MRITLRWLISVVVAALLLVGMGIGVSVLEHWHAKIEKSLLYAKMTGYAASGDDQALQQLLAHGADVNGSGAAAAHPLLAAAVDGRHLSTVRVLLQAGADPNALAAGLPLLYGAVRNADVDIVGALLDRGAHADNSSLFKSAQMKNATITKLLLAAGGDTGIVFAYAAQTGDASQIRLTLDAMADQSRLAKGGINSLPIAAVKAVAKKNGHADVVRMLEAYQRRTGAK